MLAPRTQRLARPRRCRLRRDGRPQGGAAGGSNAVVAGDNSFGNNDTLASISIDNATPREGLAGCPDGATLRVRTLDLNGVAGTTSGPYNPLLVDHRFVIWIRGDRQ
ncbi:MAG: hypothetical protein AUG88_00280 [Actinobacteria bacterium 13_1_20CM_4_68_12]|nr:MAG: hypothetical protein AUG88_00280 [Actinobacteria bacterium 13_1_20CM_4_68_12]